MDQQQGQAGEVKPGWKTTEFWVAILTVAAGLGLLVYGAVSENETALAVGGALAGLSGGGYALSRGVAKRSP